MKYILVLMIAFTNICLAQDLTFKLHNTTGENNFYIEVSIENNTELPITVPLLFISEDYYIRFYIQNSAGELSTFIGPELDLIESPDDILTMYSGSKFIQKINLADYYKLHNTCYKVRASYIISKGMRSEKKSWVGNLKSNEISLNCT